VVPDVFPPCVARLGLLFVAVVIVGQIIGASDFDASALSCRWEFVVNDDNWTVVRGEMSGKTHVVEEAVRDVIACTLL